MNLEKKRSLVAPCGIHCGICELYLAGDNPQIKAYLISRGIGEDKIPCTGCRANRGHCPIHPGACATYECAGRKGISFCHECPDYPCNRVQPAADRADILPHNLKPYNLACIEHQGIDRFLERAAEIKQRYFRGKIEIGNGPQLSDEVSKNG